jgi:hypothetical protein
MGMLVLLDWGSVGVVLGSGRVLIPIYVYK